MRRLLILLTPLLAFAIPAGTGQTDPISIRILEVVADPLTDWNQDGKLTGSDEYIELRNTGPQTVDVTGWTLRLNDSSPTHADLNGILTPGERRLIINPPGELNNNGHVSLVAANGTLIDEIRFGTWPGSVLPSADAHNQTDESLAHVDGRWKRWHATPGTPNEDPRWILSNTWNPPPVDSWWSPHAIGTLTARPIHAGKAFDRTELLRIGANQATIVAASPPGAAIQTTSFEGKLVWQIPDTPWNATAATIRLDAVAPTIILPTSPVWIRPNQSWTPTLLDNESGAVEWQWRSPSENESAWATTHRFSFVADSVDQFALRARDRVGNIGPWTTNITIGFDPTPPSPPLITASAGVTISWQAAEDSGAPVVAWNLTRTHGTATRSWELPANQTAILESEQALGRLPLIYEIRARDAAGNTGEPARHHVDHPGLHPTVTTIRIAKPHWGTGTQELRIDFDRKMDTSTAPTIDVGGRTVEEGRWFANATTYYASLSSVDSWTEGPTLLRVTHATAADAATLTRTKDATFHVDRTDPTFSASTAEGWTRASHVTVNITDATPVLASWKLFRDGLKEPEPWNATFTTTTTLAMPGEGEWVLKVTGKDAAGNSATRRFEFHIDRTIPTWTLVDTWPNSVHVLAASDDQSGVDPPSATSALPIGWTLRTDSLKRFLVEPSRNASAGNGWLEIQDRAGNPARIDLALSLPENISTPDPAQIAGSDDAATRLAAHLGDTSTTATTNTQDNGAWHGAWWTAGLVGSTALSIPLVRRAKRAKKRVPSFASRIKKARSAA